MSYMDDQLGTLAFLILDIQELIERGSGLKMQFCPRLLQADRENLIMYVSSAEPFFNHIHVIRERDLISELWDGGR